MFVPFSAFEPPIRIIGGPPDATAPHVLAFCKRINRDSAPVRLVLRPKPGCLPYECFPNVQQQVERHGGHIRFGWAIWEWPRVFIEAQHHAVYEAPDGTLIDVTPSTIGDPEGARLFLSDDSAVYDFDNPNGTMHDNIRQALTEDAQIEEFLATASEIAKIRMQTPGTGEVTLSGTDALRIEELIKKNSRLKHEIAHRYTAQGAPCYCGSGKKFKRCHGEPLRNIK